MTRHVLVFAVLAIAFCGCGKKGKQPSAAPVATQDAPPQAERRDETPPAPAIKDCVDYFPEGLVSAVGFRPAELRKSEMGKTVLKQLAIVTGTLERLGVKIESVEHVWVGSNGNRGDLVMCARTTDNIDPKSIKLELQKNAGKRVDGLDLLPISGTSKNAICIPNPKTIIAGRMTSVEAALKGGASPSRKGYDAAGPAAAFWFAGDRKTAQTHIAHGSVPLLDLQADSMQGIKDFGVGVNFGEKVDLAMAWEFSGDGLAKSAEGVLNKYFDDRMKEGESRGSSSGDSSPGEGRGGRRRGGRGPIGSGPIILPPIDGPPPQDLQVSRGFEQRRGGRGGMKAPGGGGGPGGTGEDGGGAGGGRGGKGGGRVDDAGGGGGGAAEDAGGGGRRGGGSDRSNSRDTDGDDSSGSRFASSGVTAQDLKVEFNKPEVDGAWVKFALHYSTQIVPLNAIVVQAFGGLVKGDETFRGTLDAVGAGAHPLLARSGEPLKGVRRPKDVPLHAYGYSWMCELLPHLGYDDVYSHLKFDKSWAEEKSMLIEASRTIPEFLDPADRQTRWKGYPFDELALTHFVGMSGVENDRNVSAAELPRSDPRAGIFGYDSVAKLEEIKDGATQTIMMIGAGELKGLWIQGGGATIRGASAPLFDDLTGFGSKSTATKGAFAVMADGSVREVPATIDPKVFNAMCTIGGSEKIDLTR